LGCVVDFGVVFGEVVGSGDLELGVGDIVTGRGFVGCNCLYYDGIRNLNEWAVVKGGYMLDQRRMPSLLLT
jgi:hypothetical protein